MASCLAPRRFCVCARAAAASGAQGATRVADALRAAAAGSGGEGGHHGDSAAATIERWLEAAAGGPGGSELRVSAAVVCSPNDLGAAEVAVAAAVRAAAAQAREELVRPAPRAGGDSDEEDEDEEWVDDMVEVLLTAPVPVPTRTWSCAELTSNDCGRAAHTLRRAGVAALRCGGDSAGSGGAPALFEAAVDACMQRVAAFERAATAAGRALGGGAFQEFTYADVASRGGHRFDLLIDLDAAPDVEALACGAPWARAVRLALGDEEPIMFQCSIVESRPGTTNQEWHSDGPHRGAAAGWDTAAATTHADSGAMTDDADACDDDGSRFEACAPPYAVCAFVPLLSPAGRRFGSGVGATQFWPGSHAYDQLLGFGGAASVLGCATEMEARVGDAVLYDYRCMHRGLANASEGVRRPLLQILYMQESYEEERNYDSKESLLAPVVRKRSRLPAGRTGEAAGTADPAS